MLRVWQSGLRRSAGVVLLLAIAPTTAGVYKCMDAQGRVAFSDVACPPDAKAERINVIRPPATASTHTEAASNPRHTSKPATNPAQDRPEERTPDPPQSPRRSAVYEQWVKEEKKAIIQGRPPDVTERSSATSTRSRW